MIFRRGVIFSGPSRRRREGDFFGEGEFFSGPSDGVGRHPRFWVRMNFDAPDGDSRACRWGQAAVHLRDVVRRGGDFAGRNSGLPKHRAPGTCFAGSAAATSAVRGPRGPTLRAPAKFTSRACVGFRRAYSASRRSRKDCALRLCASRKIPPSAIVQCRVAKRHLSKRLQPIVTFHL